jgi:shikimate dehydrogenase
VIGGRSISARTRLAAVIGSPIAHSLSPAMHNAGFASLGLDWVYVAFDVAAGDVDGVLDAAQRLGWGGLSVTMPLKQVVAEALDGALDEAAAALQSVNTVVCGAGGEVRGCSTDGAGFVASLAEAGVPVAGQRVGVFGAGGAGRAIVDAAGRAGAVEVLVHNRTARRAAQAAALSTVAREASAEEAASADIVVNATSLGMGGHGLPLDPKLLRRGQVLADIVYHPLETALLAAGRRVGAHCVDGLGMLVHQAVLQQALWTGMRPDPAAMRGAALAQLAA